MIGPKLSFRIIDNGKSSHKLQSHTGDIKTSARELNKICQQKYGFDLRDILGEKEAQVRTRHKRKNDPMELFYDSPDKIRRVRRRRGQV